MATDIVECVYLLVSAANYQDLFVEGIEGQETTGFAYIGFMPDQHPVALEKVFDFELQKGW